MARILFVEDDHAVADLMVEYLKKADHEVDYAYDGTTGYEMLATNTYHVAILDWDMPGMTGPEMCKKFRQAGGQTPILLLTGRHNEDDKESGLDAGADDYLTKPFSLKELSARIRSLLRRGLSPLPEGESKDLSAGLRVCVSCMAQYSPDDPDSEFCKVDGSATVLISPSRMVGRTVGNIYTIVSLLGMGAWSEVYKATDTVSNTPVALKILHSSMAQDPLKVTRFNREAEALLRLKHRCLAKVYAQSIIDSRPCLVMEYLEGVNLDKYLAMRGRFSLSQAKAVFLPICDALASAHAQGLIHRDLKPSNVFLVEQNGVLEPKVLDFGLAKIKASEGGTASSTLTGTGEVLGTPAFMSPEQCLGRPVDGRSDQYSLGCLLYEALTGHRAIPGRSAFEAMSFQLGRYPDPMNDVCPDADISREVEDLIFKLLNKDPDERFAGVDDFARAFEAAR